MSDLAIDLTHVEKIFKGKVHALRGIEMRVHRGEVFGLLGPNGAGKSTLVKIMMTLVRPTRAQGSLLGKPIGDKPTLMKVGYLPENHRFPRYLTGRQTIEFFAALSYMPREHRKRRAAELLDVVGMSAWADRKIGTYSKGMMQRVGLAQALSANPDLILLDEPTDGVDPGGRREIRDVLSHLRQQGTTVFINSHLLSELEMICDRVAILVNGIVAKQGTIDDLALAKQRYEFDVVTGNGAVLKDAVSAALAATFTRTTTFPANPAYPHWQPPPAIEHGTLSDGKWVELQGATLRVGATDVQEVQPMIDALRRNGLSLKRVQQVRPTLEDLFIEAVEEMNKGQRAIAGARI